MQYFFLLGMLLLSSAINEPWATEIEPFNGMSYIEAAEDLQSNGITTSLITELYVLAAVAQPMYRDSAILGLLSIENNADVKLELHNLRDPTLLLVPSMVNVPITPRLDDVATVETICDLLSDIRLGTPLRSEQVEKLRHLTYLFPIFKRILSEAQQKGMQLVESEIKSTLKVELAVLGGPTLWSADAVATGTRPVVVSMSDDIAALMKVDPTKRIRKNGRWVSWDGD